MPSSERDAAHCRDARRGDLGSAMLVVMAAAAILFVIAASVIGVVVFQQSQQSRSQAVMRATGLAQQGMEIYLTALRVDPDYRSRVPFLAGIGEEGTWTVAAVGDAITSVGRDARSGMFHVIRATVQNQNFSGYTIVSGAALTLGNMQGGVDIRGAVRGNKTITLNQNFNHLTVEYASGTVTGVGTALTTSRVSPVGFEKTLAAFPSMYTAAANRAAWVREAAQGDPTASKLMLPLAFYRDPDHAGTNYWAATSNPADVSMPGYGDQPDLVGVGIDFSNGSNPATGLFYVRSVWPPSFAGVSKTGAGAPSRTEFREFARTDPIWNINGYGAGTRDSENRSYEVTPRGLNPNGNNVIYVGGDYDVYVKGEYSRSVTIVSNRDIYIIGSLTRANPDSTATVGLVAKGNIYICGGMPSQSGDATYTAPAGAINSYSGLTYQRGDQRDPANWGETISGDMDMEIQAALLAVNGSIIMDPEDVTAGGTNLPAVRGNLHVQGSLAAGLGLSGPNFTSEHNPQYGGFNNVLIEYDAKLQDDPPPLFPQLGSGSLKVMSWDEYDTNIDPNAGLVFPEPVDHRPHASVPAVAQEDTYDPNDTEPPTTLANVEIDSKYRNEAVITLTPVDTGSGVASTWYSYLTGGVETTGSGRTIVLEERRPNTATTYTVTFGSVDVAGNKESTTTLSEIRVLGPDTIDPFTTVRDSLNASMTLPDGYPQVGDPDYVVYGTFYPVFTSKDTTEGTGANQVIVSQKNDPQHVSIYAEPDPPAQTLVPNPNLTLPLRYALEGVAYPATGFITREFDYYAIDAAGNREKTKTLTIKQHAPDITAPMTFFDAQEKYLGPATIHLTGVDDVEGQGIRDTWYRIDGDRGGAWVSTTSVPTTVTVPAPFIGQNDETHTLEFFSRDLAPVINTEETRTVIFTISPPLPDDDTPPVTTSDALESYVGPAVIKLTPSDAGGISHVYWRLDGGITREGTRIDVPAPLDVGMDHQIDFWAVDLSGNVEAPNTDTFTVTPERIVPVTTAHNADLYNAPAVFQLTAEDNVGGSGWAATYVKIDNGPYEPGIPGLPGLTWVTVTGDGVHVVWFYSTDRAHNAEAPVSCTFRIDETPPTTKDNSVGSYLGQASISLIATDTGSGVKTIQWRNSADGLVHSSTPVLLGPGEWDVAYWSTDVAGNVESEKRIHVVVTAAPDVSAPESYADIAAYYKYPAPATLSMYSWDVQSGVANLYYRIDGGTTATIAGKGNPPAVYQVYVSVDGTHTIEYWAADKAGNVEATHHSATFVLDTVLPVTTCGARVGATYWANQTFSLGATDVGSGVKATYYVLDGGLPVRGNSVYVPAPTDGYSRPHVIQYWSVDLAGNTEAVRFVPFTSKPADTIAPTTYSNAVSNYDAASTIALTAYDNLGGSGVAHTYYRLDSGPINDHKLVDANGIPLNGVNNTTLVSINDAGSHTLEFWSVDILNNAETPHKTVSYTIDGVAPTTTSDIKAIYNTPAVIHLTAADNAGGSDVASTFFRIDGGAVVAGTPPVTTIQVSSEGPHTLEFWSVDRADNTESHHVVPFTIDLTAPTTVSNAVASYAGTATIALSSSDTTGGSGVAFTYYKLETNGVRKAGTTIVLAPPASGSKVYNLYYWAVDNAENVETQKYIQITVTAVANITFSAMTPTEFSTVTTRAPLVSVNGKADQNITTITATIDGKPKTVTIAYAGGYWVNQGYWAGGYWEDDGCSSYYVYPYYVDTSYFVAVDRTNATASFQASGLTNGSHVVEFTYTNQSGASAKKTWSFTVNAPPDVTAPVTTSSAQSYYTAPAVIRLTAADEGGGTDVAATYYKVDGGSQIAGTPLVTTVTVSPQGAHTLEFWSVDGAGNAETHKSASFNVDWTPPTTTAGAAATYAGAGTIYLTAVDNDGGSGVKNTYYKLDSGALSAPVVGSNTVAMYHFDEGAGTTVADASGNGYSGTVNVGATGTQTTVTQAWTNGSAGRFAKSLKFDGTNDFVDLGTGRTALNNLGPAFSVAAWVKTSVNSGMQVIAGRGNDWRLYKDGSNYTFEHRNSAQVLVFATATNTSTDWVHVVGTFDASTGFVKLYLNGVLADTKVQTGTTRVSQTQNQIGNNYAWHTGGTSNDYWWNGQIDEVVFSNTARSAEDVKSYFDASTGTGSAPLQLSIPAPVSGGAVAHNLSYWSVDNAGNTETSKSVTFSVSMAPDNTPPTTTSDAVASYVRPSSITLTAVDNPGGWGVANTYYRLDGGTVMTGSVASTGLNGGHTLDFWSVDAAGNKETTKTASFTVLADTTPPVTTSNALSFYTGPAPITLTATDAGWGVANTFWRLDAGAVTTGTAITVPASVAGSVQHTIYFWSVDKANNVETTKTATFSVLAVPYPMTFSGMTPAEGSMLRSTNPNVSVTAKTDRAITVATATIDGMPVAATLTYSSGYWVTQGYWAGGYWEGEGCGSYYVNPYYVDTSYFVAGDNSQATASFPTSGLATGPHTVSVTFTVASGAQNTKTWVFTVDMVAPTTTCNAAASYNGTATFTLVAADNLGGSGVASTGYSVDTGTQQTGTPPTTTVTVAPPAFGSVTRTIYYWSVDAVGNAETQKSKTFTQSAMSDTIAPTTTSNAVGSYSAPGTITLTATDNPGGWGVAYTYYRLDGGAVTTGTAPVTLVGTGAGGTHTLEFWSVDRVPNTETHKTVTYVVTPDTTPPTTTSNAVASYTGNASITMTAVDNPGGWGVANTFYKLDGVTTTGTAVTVTAPQTGSDTHTLSYWSVDKAGNTEAITSANTKTFTVSAIPAAIVWGTPIPPAGGMIATATTPVSITAKASQNITAATALFDGSAVTPTLTYASTSAQVQVWVVSGYTQEGYWTGEGCGAYYVDPYWVDTSHYELQTTTTTDYTNATISFPKTGLTNGTHTVSLTVTVASGAQATYSWSFLVDTIAPTTTASVATSYTGAVSIPLSASDNVGGSGVAATYYTVDAAGPSFSATGGEQYVSGSNTVIVFKSSGTLVCSGSLSGASVMVVGGGGGGGGRHGYGGGAGKVVTGTTTLSGSLNVVVGDGGSGAVGGYYAGTPAPADTALPGGASTAFGLAATGGGPGYQTSGGVSGQGFAGGNYYYTSPYWFGGGGGGSTGVGGNATISSVGAGGPGTTSAISGTSVVYAKGGAGGSYNNNTVGAAGAANTGTGGGASGGEVNPGAKGGSGIVIISFPTPTSTVRTGNAIAVPASTTGTATHTITYWSTDRAGNVEGAHSATFTQSAQADTTPPTSSVVTTWTYWGGGTNTTVTVSGTDSGWGIQYIAYRLDGGPIQKIYSSVANIPVSGEGWHTIEYWSVDNANNEETPHHFWTFCIDRTPPVTTSNAVSLYTTTANISLTATDGVNCSGVLSTFYRLDGAAQVAGTSITCAGPAAGSAAHSLQFWSTDRAGNIETAKTVTFTINAEPASMVWSNLAPAEFSSVSVRNPGVSITGQALVAITGATATLDGVAKTITLTNPTSTTTSTVWVDTSHYVQGPDVWVDGYWADDGCSTVWVPGHYEPSWIWVTEGHWGTQTTTWVDKTKGTVTFLTTGLLDGVHTVSVTYTVTGGAQATRTWTFTVTGPDMVAPVTTPIYQGAYVGTATISLVATDVGGSGVSATYYKLDGGAQVTGTPPTTTVTVAPPAYGAPVAHSITFWSVDVLGNTEGQKTISLTVAPMPDTIAPTTTSNAAAAYTGTANISLTATDNPGGWGVANTYYKVDDGTQSSGLAIPIAPPTWGSIVHHIDFWSVDRAGNTEAQKTATFTVNAIDDTTPPVTSHNALTVYAAPSTITLSASDTGWGVAATYFIYDGGAQTTGTAIPTGGQGSHTLKFWSVDRKGNTETSRTVAFVVDMTAPVTTSNALPSYAGSASIILAATDSHLGGSGVKYTYYRVNDGTQFTGTAITVPGPTTGLPLTYHIDFWSVDYANNTETPAKTATFTISPPADNVAPTTTSNRVPFYSGPGVITLSATDNVGGWGVGHTYYILDSGGQAEGTSVATGGSGQHHLEYWSVDWAGNIETPHKTTDYNVDMTPPTTTSNAAASYAGTATISLTAIDNTFGSGVKFTYYRIDSGTQQTGTTAVIAPPAYDSAPHTLYFWSVDNMGNTEAQKSATFTLNAAPDTTPPTTTSNAVATYSRPATITLTATDNAGGWGVTTINYRLDGAATVAGYYNPVGGIMTATCQVGTGLGGPHTLEFWAVDKANGVESPHKTVSYTVTPDTTPPITTSSAVALYMGPATIWLTATDTGWGVAKTYYKVDGGVQTSGTVISVPAPIAGSLVHSIEFWSVDYADNVETAKTATFTVAAIPANMAFSNITPAEGSTVTTGWANLSVTALSADQNITAATLTFDGVAKTPIVNITGKQAIASFSATGLTNGAHTVAVTFTNTSGQQATRTWSFSVAIQTDYVPPTTTSNALLAYFGSANITLTATDNVGGSGVRYTYYKLDGGAQQTGTYITVAGPASGEPAPHTIQFWSVDYAGNIETTKSANFTIAPPDVTPPVSTSNAQPFYNAPSLIQLSANDNVNGAGVAHIYYILDGGVMVDGTLLGTGGVGSHVLEFWAVDVAGNIETPHHQFVYKVDVTAPQTTSDAVGSYTGVATLTLNPTDELGGSGVKSTYYRIDGAPKIAGTIVAIQPPTFAAVNHTVTFWSVDNAGNIETTRSATFTVSAPVDKIPPATTSDARPSFAVPGLITLTATDNTGGWGVLTTYYKLDGGPQTEGTRVRTGGVGSHTLEFWSVDRADNPESPHKTASYTVVAPDTAPPLTTSDAVGSYVDAAHISLVATDNCGTPPVTYYRVDSGAEATGTSVTIAAPASGGVSHTLYFWSIDINGNVEPTKSATFVVNAQPGNMVFTGISPAEGSVIAIRNPVVTVTATSAQNNLAGATIEIDDVPKSATVSVNLKQATVTLAATGLSNATHRITATFTDAIGATSVKSWTFTVTAPADTVAPVSTTDGGTVYNGNATIRLFATDNDGGMGVAGTSYKLDGGSTISGTPPTTTISVAAAGTHVVEYWSADAAGNTELPHKWLTFNIDRLAPTTTSNAGDVYTGTAVLTLTATDNSGGSGVAQTYYLVDSGTRQTGTSVSVPAPASGSQWHTVYYWSVDVAGNVETTNSAMFNVWAPADKIAPVTTSNAVATYAVPGVIQLTATDVGWGVAHTYYRLDGGPQIEGTILGTGGAGSHTLEFWSVDAAATPNVETPHKTVSYTVTLNDMSAPVTTSDAQASYVGLGEIHLTPTDNGGSGVAHTYYRWDDGPTIESTLIGVAGSGTHHIDFWSVDWVGNVESTKTATFNVAPLDIAPPVTTSSAVQSYTGTATITLAATDGAGGSGVRSTYFILDSGIIQTGLSVTIAPPASGAATHTIEYWSVDNAGNTEGSKIVSFTVAGIPDLVAPTTTHNGVASYTGTATITLTPTDNAGGSGVQATYYRIDGGMQQVGTSITVPAPSSGAAGHTIYFWSVDKAGNVEATKTFAFTVNAQAVTGTVTLKFTWIPEGYGTASLHVENSSGQWVAQQSLYGYGTNLCWTVPPLPSGQNYQMVCDNYYDDRWADYGGGYGHWTGILGPGAVDDWGY